MATPEDSATEVLPAAPVVVVAAGGAPPKGSDASLIGRTLGKFAVVEKLGRGGSGDVYRAEQPQLGRSAVIKVLRRELAATSHRTERFLREARLASRLDHPYAAHIYAFGVEPDGVLWIAMEHVRGTTLDELVLRRGAVPAQVFGPLFARLCEVVHTAHELGIIHRDIKGSNVMVIERAGQLLPKLLDFGIAKGAEPEPTGDAGAGESEVSAALTGHGATLGSPHYMAPEQWLSPAGVDARADIYALGVLAYRCVSGALPFAGIERSRLAAAHANQSAPPLPDIVEPAIAAVIMRALAKTPGARWPSALAFGEAMHAAVGGGVIESVPIFDPGTRERWTKSGPQPIADAVARLGRATTTVEADAALRELVAITCRWLAVLGLSQLRSEAPDADLRESARAVVGRDDAAPWLRLARAAASFLPGATPEPAPPAEPSDPGASAIPRRDSARLLAMQQRIDSYGLELTAAVTDTAVLEQLAQQLDERDRPRTAIALAADMIAMADALVPLEPLLSYQLVVGRGAGAESWQGARRRDRERVVLWGEPLVDGEVVLLDATGRTVSQLSPLVQVNSPMPSAEPELFLLWRSGKGHARLVAAPWGFERDDDAAAIRLAVLTTEDSETANDPADDGSPYPGLAAYGVADAHHFVGREREVESLANRLVRAPMVAVLGPSGAGKSSFIHAGLLPRLAESYEILTMRPGRHPLQALAGLPQLATDDASPEAIAARLQVLGDRAPRGVVVVVDQLEEIVTLCTDPREREAFARTLALAANTRDAPVRIVVTLRDDFASLIESLDGFRGRFEAFILATPPPEALRRIVTEPARRAAVTVEPKVVDEMVAEVAGRPASLPLLSFTASQLWQRRDRVTRRITHDAYVAIGGVAGALSTYADHVYTSLARRDQDIVRDLFSRLVARDGTRIPAPRDELERIRGAASVLAHLIDARLLVVREDEDAETGPSHDIVEIVHECLATRWDRLARWRNEDATDRALLGDVRAAVRRWQESKRRPDLLWHGEAQVELRKLAVRNTALTDDEREFARAGDAAERRARRLRRAGVVAVMAVLGVVAIVMAYLGVAATRSRGQAEQSAGVAKESARLAEDRLTASMVAQGRREFNDGRALSALAYLGEAMHRGADSTAIRTMVALANRAWPFIRHQEQGDLTVFAVTPTSFVLADANGHMRWYDAHGAITGELATELPYISDLTFAAGKLVGPGNDGILIVDDATHTKLALVKSATRARMAHLGPGADELTAVEDDGLVVYGLDGKARRHYAWNAAEGEQPAFDPSGRYVILEAGLVVTHLDLVTMTAKQLAKEVLTGPMEQIDGPLTGYLAKGETVHVLSPDGTELRSFHPTNSPINLTFAKEGNRIAAISDHDVAIFDAMGKLLYSVPLYAKSVIVRMRGDDTWVATADGVIRHYVKSQIAASLPVQETDLWAMGIVGDAIGVTSSSSNFVIVDANARQVIADPLPCGDGDQGDNGYGSEGRTMTYLCGERQLIYVGRKKVAETSDGAYGLAAYDEASSRLVIGGKQLYVFDGDGKLLRQSSESNSALAGLAFRDADHVLVVAPPRGKGLWEWTVSTDTWEKLSDAPDALGVVMLHGNIAFGTDKGDVVLLAGKTEQKRVHVGERVDYLVTSPDEKWLAVMLTTGTAVIVDGTTFEVVRELAHADSGSYATQFDSRGDLIVRYARGSLVVTDRQTGDDVIRNLDLLRSAVMAHFLPDGRMELGGPTTALVDIPRDDRPVEQILREVACRVPMKVVDGRLEPTETVCAPDLQR